MAGTPLTAVQASGSTVIVRTASGLTLRSTDSGATFASVPGNAALTPQAVVRSGEDSWRIDSSGAVLRSHLGGPFQVDARSPGLGAGASLLAAPAALPGTVIAVATDGTVWRRDGDETWGTALLLLPQSVVSGPPRVTSVAAFTQPVSATAYLATDGYSVLLTPDGGVDWIRANPGLPDRVFALAADSPARALYAATAEGLFVHHLQAFPAPPAYHDTALVLRWLGIALVALASALAAAMALARLLDASAPEDRAPA